MVVAQLLVAAQTRNNFTGSVTLTKAPVSTPRTPQSSSIAIVFNTAYHHDFRKLVVGSLRYHVA
jgi:hypothetical protein